MTRWLSVLFISLALFACAPGVRQQGNQFARFFAAADRLDQLMAAASARGGPPPRASDPQVAALFRDLTQTPLRPLSTLRVSHFEELEGVGNRVEAIATRYLRWGMPADSNQARRADIEDRNTGFFQAELTPLFGLMTELAAAAARLDTELDEMRTGPPDDAARRSNDRMRRHFISFVDGITGLIASPQLTPEHRLAIAEGFARRADQIAGVLTLSQRHRAELMIEAILSEQGPRVRAPLERARQAFTSNACTGLCAD